MHVDDEDKICKWYHNPKWKLVTQATLINESGLYSLMLSSKTVARNLKDGWQVKFFLQSENGSYSVNVVKRELTTDDCLKEQL